MIKVVPASALSVSPESGDTGLNPSKVTLNWEASSDADSYHVQVAKDPNFKKIVVDSTVSLPTADVKNLDKDTLYYWKISTLSGDTEKQIGIYSFHTELTKVPNKVDWVLIDRKNNDSVSLSWNPTFGAESYTIYRKEVNFLGLSSDYKPIATDILDPNYMDKNAKLKSGDTYSYKVTATNKIGESKKSIEGKTEDQTSVKMTALLIVSFSLAAIAIILIIAKIKTKSTKQVELANKRAS
jgi:hypothetical protein